MIPCHAPAFSHKQPPGVDFSPTFQVPRIVAADHHAAAARAAQQPKRLALAQLCALEYVAKGPEVVCNRKVTDDTLKAAPGTFT